MNVSRVYCVGLIVGLSLVGCGDSRALVGRDANTSSAPVTLNEFDATPGCFTEPPASSSVLRQETERLLLLNAETNLDTLRGDLVPVLEAPTDTEWSTDRVTITSLQREEGFGTLSVFRTDDETSYIVEYDGFTTTVVSGGFELIQGDHTLRSHTTILGCDPMTGISLLDVGYGTRCWDANGVEVPGVLQCETARFSALNEEGAQD